VGRGESALCRLRGARLKKSTHAPTTANAGPSGAVNSVHAAVARRALARERARGWRWGAVRACESAALPGAATRGLSAGCARTCV